MLSKENKEYIPEKNIINFLNLTKITLITGITFSNQNRFHSDTINDKCESVENHRPYPKQTKKSSSVN